MTDSSQKAGVCRCAKKCACECGKRFWIFGAALIACGLFVGVFIGYTVLLNSAEKVTHGYQVAEQIRKGEVADVVQAQEQMNGRRVKVGGFLSDTKDFVVGVVETCADAIGWVFGAPHSTDIKKSTLLMSGK